tara:strand:- start:65 stop:469 length:405 start_codon:yes stop_codon:yes gene_type:complete
MDIISKPWGSYINIYKDSENKYLVKKIIVKPKQRLSLQTHNFRSEHWTVVSGKALVQIGEDELYLTLNQSCFIPKKTMHRMGNTSETEDLIIIETQIGNHISEDDIIRHQDDYKRSADTDNNDLELRRCPCSGI